jgi:hypothetical protein
MSAYLYPLLTFATGLILLMGWFYVTAANPRAGKLLLKSVGFFVVPAGIAAAVPDRIVQLPFSMWVLVLIEEALKATAAATEPEPMNRFWLVVLFGIWELTLSKTVRGVEQFATYAMLTPAQAGGIAAMGVITVLMHAVTAEVYAFRFRGRLAAAFAASWVLHVSFNESVTFLMTSLGPKISASLLLLLPVALLFFVLWPKRSAVAVHQ